MDEYRAADEKARPALLADPEREPRHRFTPLFRAEAENRKGTPEAVTDWTWLVENGSIVDPRTGDEAANRLLTDHLASPELGPGAKAIGRSASVRGREKALSELGRIIDGSPHAAVKAEAFFQRGLLLRTSAAPDARRDFESAVSLAPESAAGKRAAAELATPAAPAIGSAAPRLEGRTLAGDSVTLASLAGRVVLVDFWGTWCGPCVAEIPNLRKLRERFAKKRFTLLSVNSDKDLDVLRRFVSSNRIDWVNVLDGRPDGPIATAWGVAAWPANFLVDEKGIVSARDVPARELEPRIEAMLKKK